MPHKHAEFVFTANLAFDPKFFAILPALNVNMHMRTFEVEWLWFGLYITARKTQFADVDVFG